MGWMSLSYHTWLANLGLQKSALINAVIFKVSTLYAASGYWVKS